MAERPDRGVERVAGCGLAVGREPQDLAAERVAVLGELAVAGLAGGGVEASRRGRTPAGRRRGSRPSGMPVEDRPRSRRACRRSSSRGDDPVVVGAADVEVQRVVRVERRRDRDARAARPRPAVRPRRWCRPRSTAWSAPGDREHPAESRSVTTASPSGRNASPHGTSRPVAIVSTTSGGPGAVDGAVRDGAARRARWTAVREVGRSASAPSTVTSPDRPRGAAGDQRGQAAQRPARAARAHRQPDPARGTRAAARAPGRAAPSG